MNHTNMSFVAVSGKRYAIDLLNPLDAFAWGNRVLTLFGPSLGTMLRSVDMGMLEGFDPEQSNLAALAGKMQNLIAVALSSCGELKSSEATALMTEAIKRCYTPQNESLGDESVFNRWFREHPGDLYPLGVMALVHLVKDFFPKPLVTAASEFQAKIQHAGMESPAP